MKHKNSISITVSGNVTIQPLGDFGIGNMALGSPVSPNIRLLVSGQAASRNRAIPS